MRFCHILPFLAGLAAALSTGEPVLEPIPPSLEVQIAGFVFSGSGCSAGSVSIRPSSDRSIWTLYYDNFVAQSGRNISASSQRKNCQINIKFKYPSSWQFSIGEANYRGY